MLRIDSYNALRCPAVCCDALQHARYRETVRERIVFTAPCALIFIISLLSSRNFQHTAMFLKVILLAIAHATALPNTPCPHSISIATTGIPTIILHGSAFYSTMSVATSSLPASSTGPPLLNTTSCTPGTAEWPFMMDKFRWCARGFWVGNCCGAGQVCCDKGAWGSECMTRRGRGVPTDGKSKEGMVEVWKEGRKGKRTERGRLGGEV
jgi:hypothetical protein